MSQTVTVFIADDHNLVREAIKRFIQDQPDFAVVGEAADGQEAIDKILVSQPDLVIMDISMPGIDGIQCTASLAKSCPQTRVIALTAQEETSYIKGCLAAGGKGYVLKRSMAAELLLALTVVRGGAIYLDPNVSDKLQGALMEGIVENEASGLTERETQVVRGIAKGLSAKEIARQLGIGTKTVETYKSRAMEKLHLKTRAELIRHALEKGWLVA